MKKTIIALALALAATATAFEANAATASATATATSSRRVVVRGTTRLYYQNECITLYRNGSALLTVGDSSAVEATYTIADEGNWIYFYVDGEKVASCRCQISYGQVAWISYNNCRYYPRR